MTRQELIELAEGSYTAETPKSKYKLNKFTDKDFGKFCTLECLDEFDKQSIVLHPEKTPVILDSPSAVCAGVSAGEIAMTGEIYITHLKITS